MAGKALVLSGGGWLGVAWELGVLRGLEDGGIAIGRFDKFVGTSAGAIVGAIAASGGSLDPGAPGAPRDLQLAAIVPQIDPERMGPVFSVLMSGGDADSARRRQIGAIARTTSIPEERFIDVVGQYVPDGPWPRSLVIAAVDIDDGAFVSWDADAGVSLVRAVAASSAIPGMLPPITIGGRRFMDGAMRSPTSADLAAGSDLVVVVAVSSRSEQSDRQIAAETAEIRAAGGHIVEIRPDAESGAAFGLDPMDMSRRPSVFAAGLRQGHAASGDVAVYFA